MRNKIRPQFHPVSDMEVECYLKAKKKKNIKKPFINKNLPALFCLLLLKRQFEKAGVISFFIHALSKRTS